MLRILTSKDAADRAAVERLFDRAAGTPAEIEEGARRILADVRARGDACVRELTERYERRKLTTLELARDEWEAQAGRVAEPVRRAIERAHARILRFHQAEAERLRGAGFVLDESGARLELRVRPLRRVGLYVPGGTALYPSSVLMTAVPARAAGVAELLMVTPGPSPETLYAAKVAGVDRVFPIGGAQAIGALAYGTGSVPRVDKIVGPGNAWVAAAKRLVFGDVDIDQVAGPSEILIVADEAADPRLCAADLLSQAEHDELACAVLVTPSARLARAVQAEVEAQLEELPRSAIARRSIDDHGAAVVTATLDEAIEFADRFAPEHLELLVGDAEAAAARIQNAGAIFVGTWTPEAAGDYTAGPNHVLPTGGSARFSSPLGVHDFLKRTSVLRYEEAGLRAQAADIVRLAGVEGLEAHACAVTARVGALPADGPSSTAGGAGGKGRDA